MDHLCEALRVSGREIGRDKERMSAGDSIERFAQEISKAQRVIAVISEKFLHSDYCMVYELFQTYRRCGFVREEFQAKVIALVMDDAKPILNNNLALTSLAKEWKDKYEDQRQHLEDVDPDRFSTSSWAFLNLIKDNVSAAT